MLVYFFVFALLGLLFPPFWILAILFLLGAIFGDLGKLLIMIISIPFKILGMIFGSEDEEKVVEKQTIIEKENSSNAEQLSKLSELLEKGLITEEEFQTEKAKIINPYQRA